jgi:hypothetical protein
LSVFAEAAKPSGGTLRTRCVGSASEAAHTNRTPNSKRKKALKSIIEVCRLTTKKHPHKWSLEPKKFRSSKRYNVTLKLPSLDASASQDIGDSKFTSATP